MEVASATAAPLPQHMSALAEANRVRLGRAHLKRQIEADSRRAPDLLRDPPELIASMTIGELLRAQRRWGRTRARKFLFSAAINENRAIERMTERQRHELARRLEEKLAD